MAQVPQRPTIMACPATKNEKTVLHTHLDPSQSLIDDVNDVSSLRKGDLLHLESVDPVLNAKMALVNDPIDHIEFRKYLAKLFVLNGSRYVGAVLLSLGRKCSIIGGVGQGQ